MITLAYGLDALRLAFARVIQQRPPKAAHAHFGASVSSRFISNHHTAKAAKSVAQQIDSRNQTLPTLAFHMSKEFRTVHSGNTHGGLHIECQTRRCAEMQTDLLNAASI